MVKEVPHKGRGTNLGHFYQFPKTTVIVEISQYEIFVRKLEYWGWMYGYD